MLKLNGLGVKIIMFHLLLISICIPFSNSAAGLFDDKIDEAEKLIKLSGYEKQAHELLQQAIINDPSGAKTLFRAGEAYTKMGWLREADQAFSNAYKIDNKYGERISRKYHSSGMQALQNNNEPMATSLFNKALTFFPNPKFKKEITTSTLSYGQKALDSGSYSSANNVLSYTNQIDPSLSSVIGDMYLKKADSSLLKIAPREVFELYSTSIKYKPTLMGQIEATIFEQGKKHYINGQFDSAESIFKIGKELNNSFSEKVLKLYLESMNLTLPDLEKLIKDYYVKNGEWAGIFEIEYIEKLTIEYISSEQRNIHSKYRYRAVPGNSKGRTDSGYDQRIFVLKNIEGSFNVVSMLQHNSAKF